MQNPTNEFKARLKAGEVQIGLWNTMGGLAVPEILAGAGYDWVLVDCEHSAVEAVEVEPALQTIAGYPGLSGLVRPVFNDTAVIKRVLDMGAQTLIVPYVDSVADAERAVEAMRYPTRGLRGMAGLTRATRYGRVEGYAAVAEDELCLMVQIESKGALDNLEAIAQTDGIDGVFIGPADLAASLGHAADINHPEALAAIDDVIVRAKAIDVPVGILSLDPARARDYIAKGCTVVCVGVDMHLLARAVDHLRTEF